MISESRHSLGCQYIPNAGVGQSSRNRITDSNNVTSFILVDIYRRMKKSDAFLHLLIVHSTILQRRPFSLGTGFYLIPSRLLLVTIILVLVLSRLLSRQPSNNIQTIFLQKQLSFLS
jgi:hypothetical protein